MGALLLALNAGCVMTSAVKGTSQSMGKVIFRYENAHAGTVDLVGSFNDWAPGATPLKKAPTGIWTVTLQLDPGVYLYMFVIDGLAWVSDPKSGKQIPDGFGQTNSVLIVN